MRMTTGLLEPNASSRIDGTSPRISSFLMFEYLSQQIDTIVARTKSAFLYSLHILQQQPAKLHSFKWIYGLYGLLDGVSTSFSMLKYTFDIHYANSGFSSADMLHDFLLTPEGIAIMVIESVLLAGFAAIGNVFDDDAKHTGWKKWSAVLWRYVRDALKALKNAYKGMRNLFFLLSFLVADPNIMLLVLPIGLVLGVLSALERLLIRYLRDKREGKVEHNNKLLKEINALKFDAIDTLEGWNNILEEKLNGKPKIGEKDAVLGMQRESIWHHVVGYLAVLFNSFVYGPYLFLGLVSLAVLPTPFFITIATFSSFFLAVYIATRIFDEYNKQRLLLVSQTELQLAVCSAKLKFLSNQLECKLEEGKIIDETILSRIETQIKEAAQLKRTLQQQSVLSTTAVILGGLMNGMDSYLALASLVFTISTICVILSVSYPPLLLMFFIPFGFVFSAAFVSLALKTHWDYLEKNPPSLSIDQEQEKILAKLKNPNEVNKEDVQSIAQHIERLMVNPSPQTFFQKKVEIFRLIWSGGGKGMRSVDETMVAWQDVGDDGHYHDTRIMAMVAWVSACLFGISFALRGVARLGKTKKDKDVATTTSDVAQLVVPASAVQDKTPLAIVSSNPTELRPLENENMSGSDCSKDSKETPDAPTRTPSPVVQAGQMLAFLTDSLNSVKKSSSFSDFTNFGIFKRPKITPQNAPSPVIKEDSTLSHYASLTDDITEIPARDKKGFNVGSLYIFS